MMNIRLATENRKAAALRLAEITGETSHYTKVPRCAYQVGPFFFEKDGTVTVSKDADLTPLRTLAEEGLLEPFEAEAEPQAQEETTAATEPDDADALTISLPMDGFNPDSLDRLIKLVDSKATLIKKALGATRLTIRRDGDRVSFPWWDTMPEADEVQTYLSFITALCKMSKEAQRVTAKETEVESEKYAFRCFLLRLGFIGSDSKAQRKILMRRLSGTAAFPNKEKADAFSAAQKVKRDAAKAAETEEVAACE
ncbi:MAG: virulence protein [Oscillospiraceae bacterium]|nr:virulence protein [Oscillospiraceae bacterium]